MITRWFRPYEGLIEKATKDAIDCVDDFLGRCTKFAVQKELFGLVNEALGDCLADQYDEVEEDIRKMLTKEKDVCNTQNDYYTVTLRKVQKALSKNMEMLPEEDDSEVEGMEEFNQWIGRRFIAARLPWRFPER